MNILTSLILLSSALINLQVTLAEAPLPPQGSTMPQDARQIQIDTFIAKLRNCESGGNDEALNPVDLDGTPSKGRFQFKDTTFTHFAKKYDIPVTSVWNGDEQEKILRRMIDDPKVKLQNQFPDCYRKYGYILSLKKE